MPSLKPGHTAGGSGRGSAWRGGEAESGRTGRGQDSSHRRQASLVPSKASKTRRLNTSPEARASETLLRPMEEHKERLTSSLPAFDTWFIIKTRSPLCSWLLTSGPTLFCLCKRFSCKACPRLLSNANHLVVPFETCRVQNPDTQRAGRVGTAQGGRRGGATLSRTRCRRFGRLGSQPPLWPSSAL